jgi:hypothetical protein
LTPSGEAVLGGLVSLQLPPGGAPTTVSLLGKHGEVLGSATGYFTPHSPLAGGRVLFPEPLDSVAAVSIDGADPVDLSLK